MAFVVDVVSEDSFYDNLTVGLTRILETIQGIRDIDQEKRLPCERMLITTWEQRHCCTLPEDMRQFYSSIDGFKLVWNYEYAGEILPVGNMTINAISDLRRIAGTKSTGDPDLPSLLDIEVCTPQDVLNPPRQRPTFGVRCKIFELDPCQGMGKVCLVYLDRIGGTDADQKKQDPSIWLLDRSLEWHFLAPDFTQYFRMMLVHLGLPQWQFRFTPMGLTPWAEQMFVLIAPHLLTPDGKGEKPHGVDWNDVPYNHIDPSIFKTKSPKKKQSDTTELTTTTTSNTSHHSTAATSKSR